MRKALHGVLLAVAIPPLLLAFAAIGVFTALAVLADWVLPGARFGNCFTFAAARWARHGGYLTLRPVDGVTLFGLPIPHAIWQSSLGGPVRMTYPQNRRRGFWPWFVLLFRYEVWAGDTPASRTKWIESEPPPGWHTTQPPRG